MSHRQLRIVSAARAARAPQPIYMWDVDVTWEQLEAEAPHRAYVVDCYSRSARLVRVLRSLSTVEKMLSVDIFPVVTPVPTENSIRALTTGRTS
jgi:hypothetical protein